MKIRIRVTGGGTALGGIIDGGTTVDARISAADYDASQAADSAIRVLSALGVAEHVSDGDEAAVGTTSETTQAGDAYGLIRTEGTREGIDWAFYVGQVLTTGGGLTVGGVRIEPQAESVPPEAFGESEHETAYPAPRPVKDSPQASGHPYDEAARVSKTGDAVRVVFEDRSTRLYIDNGEALFSPALAGTSMDEHVVPFAHKSIAHQRVVEPLGEDRLNFADGQE